MKELHNHIFSNTTCISKETMLRYINHQLSVKELHEVEKHMLDCELCTDALAGMKYAENSSMLFAIDNQIDQRVRTGQTKAPLMRNLMVAASLLIIVFGSYFTFDFFQETVDSEGNLAITNEEIQVAEKEIDAIAPNEEKLEEVLTDNTFANGETFGNSINGSAEPEIISVEDAEESEDAFMDDVVIAVDEMEEESIEFEATGNNRVQEQKNNQGASNSPKLSAVTTVGSVQQEVDKDGLNKNLDNSNKRDKSKDARKSKSKSKKGAFKSRAKASAPAYTDNAVIMDAELTEEVEAAKEYRSTITLSDHKVVNYIEEYQREFDMNQVVETKTESVSAGYASEEDMKKAEKERAEEKVEITYKATLEKAMSYYKAKNYVMALDEFNVILKQHPDEVNGLFYGGLSYYHLDKDTEALKSLDKVLSNKNTEFNQEAKWYKALTLIELKQTEKAKKLLQQIVAENGFYKAKAEEKLKDL
ncbi:MAG: tetratricopeptide repeat protein [Vicingaceae bacterium]|nr:tetratricopeptide repeat protein [Vicingaceae bacterium]